MEPIGCGNCGHQGLGAADPGALKRGARVALPVCPSCGYVTLLVGGRAPICAADLDRACRRATYPAPKVPKIPGRSRRLTKA